MFAVACGIAVVGLSLLTAGCRATDFNDGKTRAIIQNAPFHLEGEQVTLTQQQVDCGVGAELWESATQVSENRSTARLLQNGQNLKFSDDVAYEPGYRQPYTQVRGDFPLQVIEIYSTRDDDPETKLVDARVGVKIDHPCFTSPLIIMGVRKGKFVQDAPATIRFRQLQDDWHMDSFVH
jgi:hypothetical protein